MLSARSSVGLLALIEAEVGHDMSSMCVLCKCASDIDPDTLELPTYACTRCTSRWHACCANSVADAANADLKKF
eukprot:5200328-Pyramimonas_sp.AAC.1